MNSSMMNLLFSAFLAMVPISELRGAIPVGLSNGIPLGLLFPVCVVFNLLPVPFIILFLRYVLKFMQKCGGFLKRIADWLIERGEKKSEAVRKYEQLGLFLLVAIPLPGTGAWTGALVAAIMHLRLKKALLPIAAGVIVAGIVTTLVYRGVIHVAGL